MATSKQTLIRNKLQSKLFTPYGESVTFINKSSPIYNTRDEITGYTETEVAGVVVAYNLIGQSNEHEAFGPVNEGEADFAVPYTYTLNVDDTFVYKGITYIVKMVEPNYLPDNVVTIIRAVGQIA